MVGCCFTGGSVKVGDLVMHSEDRKFGVITRLAKENYPFYVVEFVDGGTCLCSPQSLIKVS